jgi:hypothetical protein
VDGLRGDVEKCQYRHIDIGAGEPLSAKIPVSDMPIEHQFMKWETTREFGELSGL